MVPTDEALRRSREAGLDLVEVSPTERPPVCKIMDYGKFKYSQSKQKQHHHEQKLKEIRLRPRTDSHDREIKIMHAREFLGHGDRVQFTMIFRGRERSHQEIGMAALKEIAALLEPFAKLERAPKMEGGRLTILLSPIGKVPPKKKSATQPKPQAAGPAAAAPGAAPPQGTAEARPG